MPDDFSALTAVLIIAAVTLSTRVAGVWISSRFMRTTRLECFLKHMSISVLVAIVTQAMLTDGNRAWIAAAVAALGTVCTGSVTGAMVLGVCAAALARALGI